MLNNNTRSLRAFTLIELLVVISIIAMLMAILMPALGRAREAARNVVCKSHMRSVSTGLSVYTSVNDGWLAGPNTSGYKLNYTAAKASGTSTDPVQNFDWISPTLGDSLSLPSGTYERLATALNTELCCPSNKKDYDYVYPGNSTVEQWASGNNVPFSTLKYSSYSAALGFHVSKGVNMVSEDTKSKNLGGIIDIPASYKPKDALVGSPSEKIYVIDGARYVTADAGSSFNDLPYQIDGGNFMLYGPSVALNGDPFYRLKEEIIKPGYNKLELGETMGEIYKDYAFRHNDGINAVFFDGHVQSMNWRESLKTSYYFPKGSRILRAETTADPDDVDGTIR